MKNETKEKVKFLFDRAYDILTVQLIGAVIFILIGLTVKFIGGELYITTRNLYYDAINSKVSAGIVTDDNNLVSDISSEISSDILQQENESENSNDTTSEANTSNDTIQTGNIHNNGFIWPISNGKITANYGDMSYLFSGPDNSHTGIDISAETGTPIAACNSGTVSYSGYSQGYGNYIIINHQNGISTLYAHCSELLYKKGKSVNKGDIIALAGSTGKATGSHLHLEIISKGKSIDPLWLLPPISNI